MLGFDEAARRSVRTMWLCLGAVLLALLASFVVCLLNLDRLLSDGAPACKRGELTVPNGEGIVANVRRAACAPAFAPDDIDYFVYVHQAGESDEKANLIFHNVPDNYGPFPVITPHVWWSDGSTLHIALSANRAVPSSRAPVRLKRLGSVHIVYDNGDDEPKQVVSVATHSRSAHLLSVPVWSKLHSGMKVYLGENPVDGTSLTVCPNIKTYNYVHIKTYGPYNTEATIGTSRCTHAKYGTLATVTAIIPSTIHDWYYPAPLVRVSANRWSGVTTALALQPDVPVGSILTMTRKEFAVTLYACPDGICASNSGAYNGLEIPGSVRVRVLRYDPSGHAIDSLHVQVLNGSYAGRLGWMRPSDMQSADSLYSNLYGLDYSAVPELVPNASLYR